MCTIYGVLLHFTIFCCQISFFCNLRCFVAKSVLVRFTRFCVEKNLAKNCARGEKMTNMRYGPPLFLRQNIIPRSITIIRSQLCRQFFGEFEQVPVFKSLCLHVHSTVDSGSITRTNKPTRQNCPKILNLHKVHVFQVVPAAVC